MERITMKHLDRQIKILNGYFGIDEWDYRTAGHFYVECAYGGYRLVRTVNEGGGCRDISIRRGTKREIYEQLYAMNNVLLELKENKVRS
jgi:hypothetical protein